MFLYWCYYFYAHGASQNRHETQRLYGLLTKGDKLWRSDHAKENRLGLLGPVSSGKVTRKCMVGKDGLVGLPCRHRCSLKRVLSSSWYGRRGCLYKWKCIPLLQREIYSLLLGRKGEFLWLPLSNCLLLQITFMPKRHILGWYTLIPFIADYVCTYKVIDLIFPLQRVQNNRTQEPTGNFQELEAQEQIS